MNDPVIKQSTVFDDYIRHKEMTEKRSPQLTGYKAQVNYRVKNSKNLNIKRDSLYNKGIEVQLSRMN